MYKIRCISKYFKWLFYSLAVIFPLLTMICWINAPHPLNFGLIAIGNEFTFIPHHMLSPWFSPSTKLLGFLISLIPLTIKLFILGYLIKLFQKFEQASIFTLYNANCIKKIGYVMLIGQVMNPIYQALMSAALTWHNPPGHRLATITLSGTNAGIVLTAILIILVSWIMAEAYKLSEEQRLTV